jgi:hypothetical protein
MDKSNRPCVYPKDVGLFVAQSFCLTVVVDEYPFRHVHHGKLQNGFCTFRIFFLHVVTTDFHKLGTWGLSQKFVHKLQFRLTSGNDKEERTSIPRVFRVTTVKSLTCIREVSGSNNGRDTDYHGALFVIFTILPGDQWDRTSNQATTAFFTVLSNISFVN